MLLSAKQKGTAIMNYGYIRVSTDKQTVENQRFEIEKFCESKNIAVGHWIEETESGATPVEKRKLGTQMKKLKKGDVLICTELSRLGRSLFMVMTLLDGCLKKGIEVWTTKEGYQLGDNMNSKVMAFAFGLAAEIERNLISQRTKEALAARRAAGVTLGRREGSKNKKYKLDIHKEYIVKKLNERKSSYYIAKHIHAKYSTVVDYVKKLKKV